ncbi:Pex19 protein family-domain-containing protein [Lenzites betulinus]|nr:Pex19 protein family-domain-containing protein [Lenzites betulinus]
MAAPRKPTVEEEDLDDLDDLLQKFDAPPKPAPASTSSPSANDASSAKPQSNPSSQKLADPLAGLGDDFANELTKGMESLFRDIAQGAGLDDVPDISKAESGTTEEQRAKAFQAAWEAMLIEGMNSTMNADDVLGKGKAAEGSSSAGATNSFQENIKKTMDRMKESDQKADEAASQERMNEIFNQLGETVGDMESEEELQGLLEKMMTQLMSKEVLYEPLKELHDKFPSYIQDNSATLSAEDKSRYESQSKLVTEIVTIFEDPSYSEDNTEKGMRVVELMQQMQEYGSPPAEIMGPLPPGVDLGPDGLPKIPEGCTIA